MHKKLLVLSLVLPIALLLFIQTGTFAAASVPTSTKSDSTDPAVKDTTPPIITDLKVTNLTPYGATIVWETDEPADSAVDFGLDVNYGLSTSVSEKVTDHEVVLNSTFLKPLNEVHYQVKSADAAGNTAISPDQMFTLPGVPVTVIVHGDSGKLQAGVLVTVDGKTATTDDHGSATVYTSLGSKTIVSSYNGITTQKPITVTKTGRHPKTFELNLAKQPLNNWMLVSVGLSVVVVTLLGIDAMLFSSKLFGKMTGMQINRQPTPAHASKKPSSRKRPARQKKRSR
jgi:hypothetical protein